MTREEWKERLPLIQAFASGVHIEFYTSGRWEPCNNPDFSWAGNCYRIKPEPKLRAWKSAEVPMGAIIRKIGDAENCAMITGRLDGKVKFGLWDGSFTDYFANFKDRFLEFEHSTDGGKTWHPCGILEES